MKHVSKTILCSFHSVKC